MPSPSSWTPNRRGFPLSVKQAVMRGHPSCSRCPHPATEVDHIIPVAEGGPDTLDNAQPLCRSCHWKKTREEQARGRARRNPRRPTEPHPGRI
jgi:5-methylcytosine-specific restriction enzyme A